MSARIVAAGIAAMLLPKVAHAQEKSVNPEAVEIVNEKAANADVFTFDYGVPSSPALTLLGIDKNKITQANSLKPFIIALPNLFTSKDSGDAVALEVAPGWLIPGSHRTFRGYERSYGRRLLLRTRIGGALYEGVADTDASKQKPSRAALGLSASLLDSSDPLVAPFPNGTGSAWTSCLTTVAPIISAALPNPPEGAEATQLRDKTEAIANALFAKRQALAAAVGNARMAIEAEIAALQTQYDETKSAYDSALEKEQKAARDAFAKIEAAKMVPVCMEVADLAAKLGTDLDLGIGGVWEGTAGKMSGFKKPGTVLWGSVRTTIGARGPKSTSFADLRSWKEEEVKSWVMIGASTRVGFDEAIATGDKTVPKIQANTFTGWLGLEYYTQNSRGAMQIGGQKTDPISAAHANFSGTRVVYQLSWDQQISNGGVWLGVSWGKADGEGSLKDDSTVKVNITFSAPAVRKIFGSL